MPGLSNNKGEVGGHGNLLSGGLGERVCGVAGSENRKIIEARRCDAGAGAGRSWIAIVRDEGLIKGKACVLCGQRLCIGRQANDHRRVSAPAL